MNKCYWNWIGKRIWIDLDPFLRNGILGGLERLAKKDLEFKKSIGIRIFEQLQGDSKFVVFLTPPFSPAQVDGS